jgi:hypothetical protein
VSQFEDCDYHSESCASSRIPLNMLPISVLTS